MRVMQLLRPDPSLIRVQRSGPEVAGESYEPAGSNVLGSLRPAVPEVA